MRHFPRFRCTTRAPLALSNRFVRMPPLHGFVSFTGEAAFRDGMKLPKLKGHIQGAGVALDRYRLAKHLSIDLDVAENAIGIPHFEMGFADGTVSLTNGLIKPFAAGAPLTAERVDGSDVTFEAMMRDLGVTE